MSLTQSFEEFSTGLGPMDLALYAGIGIIIWVLFKDKLSPVQKIIKDVMCFFIICFFQFLSLAIGLPIHLSVKILIILSDSFSLHSKLLFAALCSLSMLKEP